MSSLSYLVVLALVAGIFCAPAPTPVYDSYGANQVYIQEGQNVRTVSGKEFLKGVSADQCAKVCHWMDRSCSCCNSFAYKPSEKICYLKKRNPELGEALKTSNDGWQSYKYWGLESAIPGRGYTGGLPVTAFGASIGVWIGFGYDAAYISAGPKQIALQEGTSIKTSSGKDFLTNSSPKQCADDCNAIADCDAFSYKPGQNKDKGTCYMKKNSQQKYKTVINDDGLTYYWKETDFNSEMYQKCFCTCQTAYTCIMCDSPTSKCDAI